MKITIRDIAKLAKVSPTTISRFLNNDETLSISNKTKKNILDVIEKNNYTKKKYNSKKSRYKVGLIRIYDKQIELEDVYYITLRRNLENLLNSENIKYSIYDLENYSKEIIEDIKMCDCLITIGGTSKEKIEKLYNINNQMICVDSAFDFKGIDHIRYDEIKAINEIFSYILKLNHKKIGLLSGLERNKNDSDNKNNDFRYKYFIQKLKENDLLNEKYIMQGEMNTDSGYVMMKELLKNKDKPSIVFCANDAIAIGAYKAIGNKKMIIPDDVSIIGFNDLKSSKYMVPSLTTLKINLDDMADCAITLLKERIYNYRKYSKNVLLETNLIIRKSCIEYKE